MSGLPEGWALTQLGEVADFIMGQAPPGSACNFEGRGTPFVKAGEFGAERPITREWTSQPLKMARSTDVLMCVVGATCGKLNLGADCAIGRSVAAIRPSAALDQRYLYALLKPLTIALRHGSTGSAQGVISKDHLAEIRVPLPPLAEQRRIVAKLDALIARTTRARADLDRIPALAERYRRAVLQAAFGGKLTTLQTDDLGDAATLLRAPQDDLERGQWEFECLPNGWEWKSFREVFEDVTHSTRKLPTKEYQESGRYPVVDQGEVLIPGYTDREDLVHPSEPPFVVFGDHTRCVKFIEERFVQGADGVKVLRPRPNILPKYAARLLEGLELPNKGYSRHNKFLRASYFPVCGGDTQAEIVRRIDSAFAEIDRLTTEAAAARRLLDRLDQAILAKAFRGELVPQDPADEPAGVLLERIRAERAATPNPKRGRRKAAA